LGAIHSIAPFFCGFFRSGLLVLAGSGRFGFSFSSNWTLVVYFIDIDIGAMTNNMFDERMNLRQWNNGYGPNSLFIVFRLS
jgi:hypothetical protein